ncbi:hypothetical protein [Flavobacterium sp.]|uniref:hypothetical protein n=1 Tax=Flavobacterium sp. TaxID=239 RepID=UPI0037C0768F
MTSLTDIANKIINRKGNETIDGHSKHWWQHEINNARADGYTRGFKAGKDAVRAKAYEEGCRNAESDERERCKQVCDGLYKHDRKESGYDEGWNDALDIAGQVIAGTLTIEQVLSSTK